MQGQRSARHPPKWRWPLCANVCLSPAAMCFPTAVRPVSRWKRNAFAVDDGQSVAGVLFSFDPVERAKLDKAEGFGNGYEHATVTVLNDKGRRRKVLTYLASL